MPDQRLHRTILIAGPTASGKSSLAVRVARAIGAEIVNADAMQVYKDLEILSARPTAQEQADVPHHLFGAIDGATRCSAGRWATLAKEKITDIHQRSAPAIIVGGTGLYFKVLEEGLSPMPAVPEEVRADASARLERLGPEAFHAEVASLDPPMAQLAPGDGQRLKRAWEIFHATGERLSDLQSAPRTPFVDGITARVILAPPRERLYAQIEDRLDTMMLNGGLEEARRLRERGLDPTLPVMKALGAAEFMAALAGDMTEEEAVRLAKRNTRRFAKRQMTWFRNQTADWPVAETVDEAYGLLMAAVQQTP